MTNGGVLTISIRSDRAVSEAEANPDFPSTVAFPGAGPSRRNAEPTTDQSAWTAEFPSTARLRQFGLQSIVGRLRRNKYLIYSGGGVRFPYA